MDNFSVLDQDRTRLQSRLNEQSFGFSMGSHKAFIASTTFKKSSRWHQTTVSFGAFSATTIASATDQICMDNVDGTSYGVLKTMEPLT